MVEKRTWRDVLFQAVDGFVFSLLALICFYPFYYIAINTVSSNDAVARGEVLFGIAGFHMTNYAEVFQLKGLPNAALISLARTVLGTALTVLCTSFLAYAMTRKEYWHRVFWYRFCIATMYFSAGLIPAYLLIKRLGLFNNFLVYIIPGIVAPYYMVLIKTYIESIPPSLEESAMLDGAGYFTRFFRIILPLSKPVIASVIVFCSVGQWNSFMDTVLYMTGGRWQTMQSMLYNYLNETSMLASMIQRSQSVSSIVLATRLTPVSVRYTVTFITVLPILVVYPFFQRYFASGIMLGAVKG